jgi:PPK2 family polyphosphate:nucleotide phosphotransferase
MKAKDMIKPFCVKDGGKFRLKDIDPAETLGMNLKEQADSFLQRDIGKLRELQEKLYAQDSWALLLIFQAMDAAGKDGAIEHVFSGVNPQGCQVYSFKVPSPEELDHDFLWRTARCLPERGRIGIFNRSYYEEVLVVRVHPEILAGQKLPQPLVTKGIWKERYKDICTFERHLNRNGTVIRKFFLHVSKKEQKQRFLDRLEKPSKNWKFSLSDAKERRSWSDYMQAYEQMIQNTSTSEAPWYVVPADHKWFTRLVVAAVVVETLETLNLKFPVLDKAKTEELVAARKELSGGD